MTGATVDACASCGAALLAGEAFCEACGEPASAVVADHGDLDLGMAAVVSDRGLVHAHNEDAFWLSRAGSYVFAVVCDGVSASVAPDHAARTAARTAGEVCHEALQQHADEARRIDDADRFTRDAVAAAQLAVSEIPFAYDQVLAPPSCTLVAALWDGRDITVGSIGDSRAYWIDADEEYCLTVDDSWARNQIELGLATPVEVANDARAHAITHWIGADAPPDPPQIVSFRPSAAGHLVVCTDGLWTYLPTDRALADAVRDLAGETPMTIARALVRNAIAHGGSDNVTVAVVEIPIPNTTPEVKTP
jgi:serine/threonine protein phosphatase PrpC